MPIPIFATRAEKHDNPPCGQTVYARQKHQILDDRDEVSEALLCRKKDRNIVKRKK